jgi:hypothetical protein
MGQIVSGAILVEQVFAYPGIGRLLTLSIRDSDYNLFGGVGFIIIVGVSLATLILDRPCRLALSCALAVTTGERGPPALDGLVGDAAVACFSQGQ